LRPSTRRAELLRSAIERAPMADRMLEGFWCRASAALPSPCLRSTRLRRADDRPAPSLPSTCSAARRWRHAGVQQPVLDAGDVHGRPRSGDVRLVSGERVDDGKVLAQRQYIGLLGRIKAEYCRNQT
jgi:hypothetical protein